eukprot:344341-Prorocentrum_minimum.AAC.3
MAVGTGRGDLHEGVKDASVLGFRVYGLGRSDMHEGVKDVGVQVCGPGDGHRVAHGTGRDPAAGALPLQRA